MNVLILTEGGKDIGFGHITRCTGLYQGIKKIIPRATIEFIIYGDKEATRFLEMHEKYAKNINWHEKKKKMFEATANSDVVIIDSYLAKKSVYDKISKITKGRLLMIDDYKRLDYPRGIVVNPSICGGRFNYSKKTGTTYLHGRDYIILRKEFWRVPKKDINEKVKSVLVTLGGMKRAQIAERIIENLKKKMDLKFLIVEPYNYRLSAGQMVGLMSRADICISGGGQTTYELARCGVPAVGICFADNQTLNLQEGKKAAFLEPVGRYDKKGLFQNVKKVLEGLDFRKRIMMSQAGQNVVDGQGAIRVIKELVRQMGS
ncbi:MAG: glycosyltransferase [Candidatus Omnitrophica bacterium]|nr:glycosyltransferase [Candidatus Omnitrophota bacterium]